MARIDIDPRLLERAKEAAAKAGYASVEELVTHAIENELKRLGVLAAEEQVTDQLRGLGYLE